jgi:4-hydroxybenzoate polyprenyltransferase
VRPQQWLKNILIVPLPVATATGLSASGVARLGWSVLVFVLASCLVYVGNDITDRHRDRLHPTKRHRPIAAGLVPVPVALAFAGVLLVLLAGALTRHPYRDWWPVLTYLALNVAYSQGLKHVPLLDLLLVALGFELRLAQGYVALREPFPTWLPVCLLGVCVMLLVGKRRSEMTTGGDRHRPALRGYSVPYLDQLLGLTAALVCVAFVAYLRTEAPLQQYRTAATLLCAPLALLALFRYLQVAIVRDGSGDPVRLLVRDRAMVVNTALCVLILAGLTLLARFPNALPAVLEKVT